MDILKLYLSVEAVNAVFRLGFLPAKEEFYELTPEQYAQYYSTNEKTNDKIFMLLPNDPQTYSRVASGDMFIVTEQEVARFEKAGRIIESYCKDSEKTFATFEKKLRYVAGKVPSTCLLRTKYARLWKRRQKEELRLMMELLQRSF
ncbi:MAG: hypothetical protein LBG47_10400 [Prevotellaceae bacterium]|nr:hypothetical protein [Prevotellaceae bacterium]